MMPFNGGQENQFNRAITTCAALRIAAYVHNFTVCRLTIRGTSKRENDFLNGFSVLRECERSSSEHWLQYFAQVALQEYHWYAFFITTHR